MATRNKKGYSLGWLLIHLLLGFATGGLWWIVLLVRFLITK